MKYLTFPTRFAVFLVLFASALFSQTPADSNRNAILYEISGNGLEKPSYVFGTIHLICSEDMLDMEQLSPYLKSSKQVVMELDLTNPFRVAQKATAEPKLESTQLNNLYTKEELEMLDKVTREYLQMPISSLNTMNPALIQLLLIGSPKMTECKLPTSYELAFTRASKESKTPMHGLETVEDQINILAEGVVSTNPARGLLTFISQMDEYKSNFKKLVALHKDQNLAGLYKEVSQQTKEPAEFENALLTKRNLAWLPKLETFFRDKPTFVAVGAAHLGGQKGVLNLLEEKGFSVKPMRLEAKTTVGEKVNSK